jgi:hypothetical protein
MHSVVNISLYKCWYSYPNKIALYSHNSQGLIKRSLKQNTTVKARLKSY